MLCKEYKNISPSLMDNRWGGNHLWRISVVGKQSRIWPAFTPAAGTAVVCSIKGIVNRARPVAGDHNNLGKVRGAPNIVKSPCQLLCGFSRAEGRGEDSAPAFHNARTEG